jgi:hypothetical protein
MAALSVIRLERVGRTKTTAPIESNPIELTLKSIRQIRFRFNSNSVMWHLVAVLTPPASIICSNPTARCPVATQRVSKTWISEKLYLIAFSSSPWYSVLQREWGDKVRIRFSCGASQPMGKTPLITHVNAHETPSNTISWRDWSPPPLVRLYNTILDSRAPAPSLSAISTVLQLRIIEHRPRLCKPCQGWVTVQNALDKHFNIRAQRVLRQQYSRIYDLVSLVGQ